VSLGGFTAGEAELLWYDLPAGRFLGGQVRGVLGQSFLSRFNYLLDLEGRQFVFEDGDEKCPRRQGQPLRMLAGVRPMAVIAEPVGGGNPLKLILDTGTPDLVLFRKAPGFQPSQSSGRTATNFGSQPASIGRLRMLRMGRVTLFDLPAALLENPAIRDAEGPDGLFPLRLLTSIYVNNKEGYVILNPAQRSSNREVVQTIRHNCLKQPASSKQPHSSAITGR
jgi:hypothetical protein